MKIDSSADVIRHLAKRENKKLKEIAQNIGQSSSNFSNKLKNNNLTAQDFIKALGYMGYSIYLAKNDKQVIPEIRKGIGDPLKGMVEGVMYDTVKSDAVCHTECIYGMHVELYRDAEGRFFVAEYGVMVKIISRLLQKRMRIGYIRLTVTVRVIICLNKFFVHKK